jgi:tRNA nucleotidyltransferase (CCA-adding enzyme)
MTPLSNALELLRNIKSLGYDAYVVGGAVRDLLVDKKPSDIDIATNCPVPILQKKFSTHFVGQSQKYNTIIVRYNAIYYEVTQFRKETDYDGHNPTLVTFVNTLEEDVKRRDFTVNAMAMDHEGTVYDYVDGEKDLKNKLIKAVGDPDQRFKEDYARMVRAARFACAEGFNLEEKTAESIQKYAHLITRIKPERINLELIKVFTKSGKDIAKFIILLDELCLLHYILPEIEEMKYFKHNPEHHPEGNTVFDHTIECLKVMDNMSYLAKISALFHDVGKSIVAKPKENSEYPSYYNHASVGASIAIDVLTRFKFSPMEIECISYAVMNHMKFHDILSMRPSKIASLVNSPYFDTLKDVAWADEFCRGERFAYYQEFDEKIAKIKEIKSKWKNHMNNKSFTIVSGYRIMELLGISSSPQVGKIKDAIEEYIIDNSIVPDKETIDRLIKERGATEWLEEAQRKYKGDIEDGTNG